MSRVFSSSDPVSWSKRLSIVMSSFSTAAWIQDRRRLSHAAKSVPSSISKAAEALFPVKTADRNGVIPFLSLRSKLAPPFFRAFIASTRSIELALWNNFKSKWWIGHLAICRTHQLMIKVQLTLFLVFVSNCLLYNIKHFCENVLNFGQIFQFPYYFETQKRFSISVHWPRPEGDWR
mgnify:CR=1 FL=1